MRSLLIFFNVLLFGSAIAQTTDSLSSGEITDAEVIIQKERSLLLPKADRIFKKSAIGPKEALPILKYAIEAPQVSIPDFRPQFKLRDLQNWKPPETFHNELKVGFGNFISPLIVFTHENTIDRWSYRGRFFHESFLNGPVRDDESGSSLNHLSGSLQYRKKDFVFDAGISFFRQGYFFYGLSDEAFIVPDSLLITDRVHFQHWSLRTGVSGHTQDAKFDYYCQT